MHGPMNIKNIHLGKTLTNFIEQGPYQKLVVSQLLKKYSPHVMEHEGSLPCSQNPAICPSPETDKSILHTTFLFLEDPL
jgi:hypothetical protein